MQQTMKGLSIAVTMFAIVGMTGITSQLAYADNGIPQELRKNKAYNLNVIGFPKGDKDFSNDENSNGKRIFVPLVGKSQIKLQEGPFEVIDFDGVSDGVAIFQLPKPNLACTDFNDTVDPDTTTECDRNAPSYFVFARALGQPNGAVMVFNTCASELDGQDFNGDGLLADEVCSTEILEAGKLDDGNRKGGSKFSNVTKELLTICVDTIDDGNLDGECDIRADIFDDRLVDYLWNIDNNGRKLVQLVFVEAAHV